MAEPMHARVPARHPANRRPRIPHPHLAPQPQRPAREEEAVSVSTDPPDIPVDHHPTRTGSSDWTPLDVPLARPASRSRRAASRPTPAEKTLRAALHTGLFVNVAVLLASRLLPKETLGGWTYGGDDFLLAAAVLLSGYALLAAGRLSRREDRGED